MNTATRNQEVNPMLFPVYGKHHVWTEQELRAECMTVDESQQDLHQMIDNALMNVALENSRIQAETGDSYSQTEARKMRHEFVMSHKR